MIDLVLANSVDPDDRSHHAARELIRSVVECLTRDRGVAGSSVSGITALCP